MPKAPVLDTTRDLQLQSIYQGVQNPVGTLIRDLVEGIIQDEEKFAADDRQAREQKSNCEMAEPVPVRFKTEIATTPHP